MSQKSGKIGELRIIRLLLEEGFDVLTPVVDDFGIDIVSRHVNGGTPLYKEIQVKNSENQGGKWWYGIRPSEIENPSDPFFAFVLKDAHTLTGYGAGRTVDDPFLLIPVSFIREVWDRTSKTENGHLRPTIVFDGNTTEPGYTWKLVGGTTRDVTKFVTTKFEALRCSQESQDLSPPERFQGSRESPKMRSRTQKSRSPSQRFIILRGKKIPIHYWYNILIEAANHVFDTNLLSREDVPIESGRKRYFVNHKPEHKDGTRFMQPKKLNCGLFVETKNTRGMQIKLAKKLLKMAGLPDRTLKTPHKSL